MFIKVLVGLLGSNFHILVCIDCAQLRGIEVGYAVKNLIFLLNLPFIICLKGLVVFEIETCQHKGMI
jgi:hypothetical protein